MFERFTEAARHALFLALLQARNAQSPSIETDHLLAGIVGADLGLAHRYPHLAAVTPRPASQPATPPTREPVPRVDLPLSNQSKRGLAYAAVESTQLKHGHIGTRHLLIGLLRADKRLAAELLRAHGITLEGAREDLSQEGGQSA